MSLFTIFAAALETLLYRYTGSEDIVLGIALAEREHQELQSLIGFLLHIQALRTKLSGDMTFRELLALMRTGSMALYSHREVPFEQVVARIRPERSLSHSPLFQVMINWRDQDQHLSYIGLDGLQVESLLSETRTSKFDLTLQLTDFGNQVWLEAEYSTDLFDDDRIARMFGHYQTILEAAAANPAQKLAALPLLTVAERKRMKEWNTTEAAYPHELCIHQLFEAQVERTPEAVAVASGGHEFSYAELNRRANQLARHLCKLGVKPETLVAIATDRTAEMVIGLLGILKAGGAYLPLDPGYPRERLGFMLEDSRAALILTQEDLRDILPGGQQRICLDSDWPAIAAEATSNLEPIASADNLAYVIYTSGSTGRPKGVEITHRSMANLLWSMRQTPGLSAADTLVAVTTLSFDIAGLELFLPLITGAKLIIASRDTAIDGNALMYLLHRSGATVIQATPITFRMLIAAGWRPAERRIKALCGGEALPRALADQILERGAKLWNCYGPTETTVWSSVAEVPPSGPITVGRPIANTQFYILDSDGEPCPIGKAGELHIGGAGLARGYLRRNDLTAEKFITIAPDGAPPARVYRTGDLARFLPDGDVECLGRIDHQVKLRGFRIELEEIEAVLAEHPKVAQCVVMAREDGAGDKRLAAYIVLADPKSAPPLDELRERLKRKLPEYMVPAAFVMTAKLPLTANGKIDRKALPAPELYWANSTLTYVAPRTPLEEVLAELCRNILKVKQIGVNDNFFDMGGDSLLAMRLIAEIRGSLSHTFAVAAFFQNPTIAHMAEVLQEEKQPEIDEGHKVFHVVLRGGTKALAIIPADAPLLTLQAGDDRPPFFMVDSFPYFIDVVRLLGGNQPMMSLVSRERAKATYGYDIAKEATRHVETIQGFRPAGPIMIGGCSASGIVAYETALQLQRRGREVGLLALFDTVNPYFMRAYSPLRRSLAFNQAQLKGLRWSEVPGWLAAKLAGLMGVQAGAERRPASQNGAQGVAAESPLPQFGLSQERIAAARKYRPQGYSGRFLLFKGKRGLGGRYLDPQFGWNEAVHGKIEVYQLDADEHLEIFKAESDRSLVAEKLRNAFDEVAAACFSSYEEDHIKRLVLAGGTNDGWASRTG